MSKYDECIKNGFLRHIPPSKEKAQLSLNRSQRWLNEAKITLQSGAYGSSVLASYNAMFHTARANLFFDGVREKNHFCLARYLEEKYVKSKLVEKSWIELLDHYRELRHEDQYSISFFASINDAENSYKSAYDFSERIVKLLNSKN